MSLKKPAITRRQRHSMPNDMHVALETAQLYEAYRSRPPYQQNDYIGWITHAVRPETRQKRLQQMLDELRKGDVYMKMSWRAGKQQ